MRAATGAITIDPGYKNSGSCKSEITFLDGEEGILRYRGYAIEELAEKADFLEVSYLIIFGELPTKQKLEQFENDIRKYTLVNEEMKNIIDGFPKTAHPMGVLSSLTSALTAFNPKVVNVENEKEMYSSPSSLSPDMDRIMALTPLKAKYSKRPTPIPRAADETKHFFTKEVGDGTK